jgi:hypothetical protein
MPAASGPRIRFISLCVTTLLIVCLQPLPGGSVSATKVLPPAMLWAWERPSDLRGLGPDVGVAFLAQTITIDTDHVSVQSRRWPLKVAPDTVLSAVTRIEMPQTRPLSDADVLHIVNAIAVTASYPQVAAVQIDFDATESQRDLYRRLITSVRARLEAGVPLSITALASWCVGDRWLDELPIDEAVPMLFDMGPIDDPYRSVAIHPRAAHPLCRSSIGMSLREPMPMRLGHRRLYVFNPRQWTREAIELAPTPSRWAKER